MAPVTKGPQALAGHRYGNGPSAIDSPRRTAPIHCTHIIVTPNVVVNGGQNLPVRST